MSRVNRRVTAVLSDSLRKLHMVEVKAKVKFVRGEKHTRALADLQKIQQEVDERLESIKLSADHVGVLVALDVPLEEGRIVWVEDIKQEKRNG